MGNSTDSIPYSFSSLVRNVKPLLWKICYLRSSPTPDDATVLGHITPLVARRLIDSLERTKDHRAREVIGIDTDGKRFLLKDEGTSTEERTRIFRDLLSSWREDDTFDVLRGWRDEEFPIYGPDHKILLHIERSATPLFGFVTYGVHMTAYRRIERDDSESYLFWTPRRSLRKTYPGMLDNTVAGEISSGEKPFETLVREAMEEAALPEELVRSRAKAVGMISYVHVRDVRAGGEVGLIQPECEYVYDLEVDEHVIPRPNDGEVESFSCLTLNELEKALRRGEFKPNCALVLLDFLIRHGILTAENEFDYAEIITRLHRKLEYPVA